MVVEPIVTEEKLRSLLAEQCELSCLDFKQRLDLGKGSTRDTVELAKDVAALQSEPDGGYIVIGADDHGKVVADLTPDLARHFDDATLRPKLGKYLVEPEIRCARHEVDGETVALIYVAPSSVGWCIFKANGEYEEVDANGKRKKEIVFRIGDVFVRHGTRSERWTDTDRVRLVDQVVARRKESWRREQAAEWAARVDLGLTARRLEELPAAAVTWRLDAANFDELITELMRRGDDIPVRQMLDQATRDAAGLLGKQEELRELLDRLTSMAALAIRYERPEWLERTVSALVRIYELGFREDGEEVGGQEATWLWFDVVTRVYALGALAVRSKNWSAVRLLATQQPNGRTVGYYAGWVRHALVKASNAGIVESDEAAGVIARAHNHVRAVAALHPDLPAEDSTVLSSLCQFDAYGALVIIGDGKQVSFYPSFARYYSYRTMLAFHTLITDPVARAELFRGDDQLLADAIVGMDQLAHQDFRFNAWDGLEDKTVLKFVQEHRSE